MCESPNSLSDTADVLRAGGVAILGTDTLPGFHCLCRDVAALGRIAALKGRRPDKPLLVLAADMAQVQQVVAGLEPHQEAFCRACWPGPFSLILPAVPALPRELIGTGNTVAVRVPRLPALVKLLQKVGGPLASTSVNREGESPARSLAETGPFQARVDAVWQGERSVGPPVSSAVIDATCRPPRVLREGPEQPPKVSF